MALVERLYEGSEQVDFDERRDGAPSKLILTSVATKNVRVDERDGVSKKAKKNRAAGTKHLAAGSFYIDAKF